MYLNENKSWRNSRVKYIANKMNTSGEELAKKNKIVSEECSAARRLICPVNSTTWSNVIRTT